MIGTGNVTQPYGLPLETEGILRWEIAIINNQFKDVSSTAGSLKNIEDITKISIFPNSTAPNGINDYPQTINGFGLSEKTVEGGFRKNATIKNLYLDVDKQVDVADWISLDVAPITQQISGYLDTYGGLNIGGSAAIQASSIIGSVLNGEGLGLAKGGVATNFDIRSSLAGRVLSAAGVINDTKLGMIGGQQLALSLANNAAFNLQQDVLGRLNIRDNVLSLIKGNGLTGFRPSYQITVPGSTGGKIADYASKILGFSIPRSYLGDEGSIFASENGNIENIARANSMLENTGKGQTLALLSNSNANLIGTTEYDNPSKTAFRSGYAPAYSIEENSQGVDQPRADDGRLSSNGSITNGVIYAYTKQGRLVNPLIITDGVIPDLNYQREGKTRDSGFLSPEDLTFVGHKSNLGYNDRRINDVGFSWGTLIDGKTNTDINGEYSPITGEKKSLLFKTQKLFDSIGMKTLVTVKGEKNKNSSQTETTNGGGISKGSAVLSKTSYTRDGDLFQGVINDTPDETYCRSWTTLNRYDNHSKLIRNSGLTLDYPHRFQIQNSTLDEYGIPKIAPYTKDNFSSKDTVTDPKKYMFSIENLAWNDNLQQLLPVEIGTGDLVSGKRGRIMWFPPYNIQFNESSSVSWETTNFIGRGESVYTYNNTERSGTLSFQIIVDHPSYINKFRDTALENNYVASFFAGCVDPTGDVGGKVTVEEISELSKNSQAADVVNTTPETPPPTFYFYFPNDETDVMKTLEPLGDNNQVYENGLSGTTPDDKIDYNVYVASDYSSSNKIVKYGIGEHVGSNPDTRTSKTSWLDRYNFGLNGWFTPITLDGVSYSGITDQNYIKALSKYLDEKCPNCVINVKSFASPQGKNIANDKLANGRTKSMIEYLKAKLYENKSKEYKEARIKDGPNTAITSSQCIPGNGKPTDTKWCKLDRRTEVSFSYDPSLLDIKPVIKEEPVRETRLSQKIVSRAYDESKYFEQLTNNDPFVFDKFREKIKYFHPAFHSTTPEGLNSRLTFLQQCTRQGPTLEKASADNLAFGRPPICILRIGDFYNTKIIIDNLSIDYEPLVWDLNPEGVGVQPMIANVNLSFKFIGGSTLMSPINKLQNALSFNYYANTHVYDPRADYVSKNPNKGLPKTFNGKPVLDENDKPIIDNAEYAVILGEDINKFVTEDVAPEVIGRLPIRPVNQILTNESNSQGQTGEISEASTIDFENMTLEISYEDLIKVNTLETKELSIKIIIKVGFKEDIATDHTFSYYLYDGKNKEITLSTMTIQKEDGIKDTFEFSRSQYVTGSFDFSTPPNSVDLGTYKIKVVFDGNINTTKWGEIKF